MQLHRLSVLLLSLACSCNAGPLVALVLEVGGEALAAFLIDGGVAGGVGLGTSSVFYGSYVVVDSVMYWGSAVAGGVILGGGVGAGIGAGIHSAKVHNKHDAMKLIASISSASVASVASDVASAASVTAADDSILVSLSSVANDLTANPTVPWSFSTEPTGPWSFSFNTSTRPKATSSNKSLARRTTSSLPPPPGTPVSTLPPGTLPTEIPAGVPEYNFRMCQYAIIEMGTKGQNLTFDNPEGYSLTVDNVPPTCMVLSSVLLSYPDLGPHPYPVGNAALRWDNMKPDTINLLRQAFGLPPVS